MEKLSSKEDTDKFTDPNLNATVGVVESTTHTTPYQKMSRFPRSASFQRTPSLQGIPSDATSNAPLITTTTIHTVPTLRRSIPPVTAVNPSFSITQSPEIEDIVVSPPEAHPTGTFINCLSYQLGTQKPTEEPQVRIFEKPLTDLTMRKACESRYRRFTVMNISMLSTGKTWYKVSVTTSTKHSTPPATHSS